MLDHPNLVKAYDVDQENGVHYLVMDYVDGYSLQQIVSRFGPLSIELSAHSIRQAAQGLQAAHAAGLVHRDIKPANILLDCNGVIRVLDLGLALFFSDREDPLTLKFDNKPVLGTADYVAPEQALDSHEVDSRADIYSLGATFHFLLAGQPLFPKGQIAQKLIWHQTLQPEPLRHLRPEVPAELAAIVERMIAKSPDRRYQTSAEVIEALQPWTANPLPHDAWPVNGASASRSPLTTYSSPDTTLRSPRPRTMAELTTPPFLSVQMDTEAPSDAPPTGSPAESVQTTALRLFADVAPRTRLFRIPWINKRLISSTLLLMLGAFTGIGIRIATSRDNSPAKGPAEASLQEYTIRRVSHASEDYPSVSAALQEAPDRTAILICEANWEEVLHFNGGDSPGHSIRIEGRSPTGSAVCWRPPPGHPVNQPLLQISDGTGLTLKGFRLDGQDCVNNLVSLHGSSAGLLLEDLHLYGFRHNGVVLHGCKGSGEQPVTLQRLCIAPTRLNDSAVLLETDEGEANQHIRILDCCFEGRHPVAVRLNGPALDIELNRNRE
jgi:serine/threonine protein kinase